MDDQSTFSLFDDLPVELDCPFASTQPNEPLRLYEGSVTFEQSGKEFTGNACVELSWLPYPAIRFCIDEIEPEEDRRLSFDSLTLHVPPFPQALTGDVRSAPAFGGKLGGPWSISGDVESHEKGLQPAIVEAAFCVPNFREFVGEPITDAVRSHSRSARATFDADGWKITLDGRDDCWQYVKELQRIGGFGITHAGKIERRDGQPFSSVALNDVLEHLRYFLSFCAGRWVAPLIPVGRASGGGEVWSKWDAPMVARSQLTWTWLNNLDTEGFIACYPGFVKRWQSDLWREPLRLAIYWYVESSLKAGGIEGSIILTQAALELLSAILLVEEKRVVGRSGFRKMDAVDKIRLLLSTCGIPLEIPQSLSDLIKVAKAESWQDGPHALAELRNALLHTEANKLDLLQRVPTQARFEVGWLGLWHLELILLRLFEYEGKYANRTKRADWWTQRIDHVPWVRGNQLGDETTSESK